MEIHATNNAANSLTYLIHYTSTQDQRQPSGLSCLAGKGKSERFKKEEPDEPQDTSNADPNSRPISVLKSDYRFLMVLFLILYHFSIFILINCS